MTVGIQWVDMKKSKTGVIKMEIGSINDLITSLELEPKWPGCTYENFDDGTDATVMFDMGSGYNIITGSLDTDILSGKIKFTQVPYTTMKTQQGIHSGRILQMWLKKNETGASNMSLTFLLETQKAVAESRDHGAYTAVTIYPFPALYSYVCCDLDIDKQCTERLKLIGEWNDHST